MPTYANHTTIHDAAAGDYIWTYQGMPVMPQGHPYAAAATATTATITLDPYTWHEMTNGEVLYAELDRLSNTADTFRGYVGLDRHDSNWDYWYNQTLSWNAKPPTDDEDFDTTDVDEWLKSFKIVP